jgi:hypothetical protein
MWTKAEQYLWQAAEADRRANVATFPAVAAGWRVVAKNYRELAQLVARDDVVCKRTPVWMPMISIGQGKSELV